MYDFGALQNCTASSLVDEVHLILKSWYDALSRVYAIHTCQPREKFWRDKRGATERSEPTSEGGNGGPPRNISKTYIANGAIYVIPELYL